jgi:hypothetical protein
MMPTIMRFPRLILALLALVTALPAAAQAPPKPAVALVLEISSGRLAGLEPYREVAADTRVTVPDGVRFVFQHYASCRRYTMVGGTATLRADGVEVVGPPATSVKVACPQRIRLRTDASSAAVTTRSMGPPRTPIAVRPQFVVVGARTAEIATLRVRRGADVVLEQRLTGGPVAWPSHLPPLAPATNYELELLPVRTDREPIVIGLRTGDGAAVDETITVVSAD